jgi:hypothetical protein
MVPRPAKVVRPDATDIPAPQRARTRLLDLRSSWNSVISVLAGSTGMVGYFSSVEPPRDVGASKPNDPGTKGAVLIMCTEKLLRWKRRIGAL